MIFISHTQSTEANVGKKRFISAGALNMTTSDDIMFDQAKGINGFVMNNNFDIY